MTISKSLNFSELIFLIRQMEIFMYLFTIG